MYSNWIPQNLQKRVFLYILQQLQLFSGIELPNLEEVSFNNIHLRDVSLDPEKITKIPGITLRHGNLRHVTLKGSIKDGARLDISGVDLVVAPHVDNLKQDMQNAQASLAQSSADLASTILLDSPTSSETSQGSGESYVEYGAKSEENIENADNPLNLRADSAKNVDFGTGRRPSFSGGVMAKAMDIALSKLQVHVTNIKIKVILEPIDLFLEIGEVSFSYKLGLKSLRIKGVKLSAGKPLSGMKGHSNKSSHSDNMSEEYNESDESDNNESDESDENADSLTDSMVFTHEEASSIYMSATSQSFGNAKKDGSSSAEDISGPEAMVFIDIIDVSFEDVSPLSHLKVDIHTINVSAVPLLPAIAVLSNSLSKLFKLSIHQLKKRNSLHKQSGRPELSKQVFNSPKNDASADDFLDRFHIGKLEVSLTSSLDENGTFASLEDEVSVVLDNFTMKLKDESLVYGGLETFEVLRFLNGETSGIFSFNSKNDNRARSETPSDRSIDNLESSRISRKADLRFENARLRNNSGKTASELTVLISRPGILKVDASSLDYLINFFRWISTTSEAFSSLLTTIKHFNELQDVRSALTSTSKKDVETSRSLILQTASFEMEVEISAETCLKVAVLPISFDGTLSSLTISKIDVDVVGENMLTRLVSLSDLCVSLIPSKFDSFSYTDSKQSKKSTFKALKTMTIGSIDCSSSHAVISQLLEEIKSFQADIENRHSVNSVDSVLISNQSPAKTPLSDTKNLMNSVYASQNRYKRMNHTRIMFGEVQSTVCPWRLSIGFVDISLSKVTNAFGGLEVKAEGIEVINPANGIGGYVMKLAVHRDDSLAGTILEKSPISSSESPVLQFYQRSESRLKYEVVCRELDLTFDTAWTKLFGNSGEETNSSSLTKTDNYKSNFDLQIRFTYHDFSLGITPGRLRSKLVLVGSSGTSDLTFNGNGCGIKSSFRDLQILLIDDIHASHKEKQSHSALSRYLDAGYVTMCQINLVHIGIDFAENDSTQILASTSEISLVKLKVNVDVLRFDPCADSAHTFLQTINDLKDPVLFKESEKYRVKVQEGFELSNSVFESVFENIAGALDESSIRNIPEQPKTEESIRFDESYTENLKDAELSSRLNNVVLEDSPHSSEEISSLHVLEGHFSKKEHPHLPSSIPFSMVLNVNTVDVFLHDGYDWKSTRKSIKSAVHALQEKAAKSGNKELSTPGKEPSTPASKTSKPCEDDANEENETHVSHALFHSIFIEMDKSVAASNIVEIINAQMAGEDISKEAEYEASTNVKIAKGAKNLKLRRSRVHKVSAQCKNISVSLKTHSAKSSSKTSYVSEPQVVNEIQIRLDSVDVEDNVQSSTWSKMVTYMNLLGERETGTNMFELDITNVRPDSRMPYAEAVINVKILPLRLFIDQDTLGFVTRFFSFRDSRFALAPDEIIFVQKLTIEPLRMKFDYKPKSIDYAGIRSGNNAEWANFFVLDGSDLKLRQAVVYGVHGFSNLGRALGQIYGPYIQKYQLLGLLSGLTPVRSVLNVGKGVRELVNIPVQEYKKDGRLYYGLQKGSAVFAKTTANELLRLGVKLASGAQVLLENSEEYLGGEGASARRPKREQKRKKTAASKSKEKPKNLLESSQILRNSVVVDPDQYVKPMSYIHSAIDEEESDPEVENLQSSILVFNETNEDYEEDSEDFLSEDTERHITSLYSNQPVNAKEGLKSAYKAMGKNLKGSQRKIKELRRELKNADTFQDQMLSVAKKSPVIMIRPLIGGTEAVMKTLIGISNGIDSRALQESRDKYRTEDS